MQKSAICVDKNKMRYLKADVEYITYHKVRHDGPTVWAAKGEMTAIKNADVRRMVQPRWQK